VVVKKIQSWKGKTPFSPETGALMDVFGYAYAADQGVFELDELEPDEHAMDS
jgi:hypothetical protein